MKNLNSLTFMSTCFFILFITIFVYFTYIDINSTEKSSTPFGIDYADYYTAGKMVLHGDKNFIYSIDIHHSNLEKILDRNIPFLLAWVYPPIFLLLIVPLALLPYYISLYLWVILTLTLFGISIYKLTKSKKLILIAFGYPGLLMNLKWGQNSFLSSALIGFALYFIEINPILSGIFFGLLSYKPQLLLFPFIFLVCLRKWRILLWTFISSISISLLSAIAFGLNTWLNFINSFFISTTNLMEKDWINIAAVQPSLISFFKLIGIPSRITYIIFGINLLIISIIVLYVWRVEKEMPLKIAVFIIAMILSMPYFIQYELLILSISYIFIIIDFIKNGSKVYEKLICYLLWIMPLINWPLVAFTKIQICPIILYVVLIMLILRVNNAKRSAIKIY